MQMRRRQACEFLRTLLQMRKSNCKCRILMIVEAIA